MQRSRGSEWRRRPEYQGKPARAPTRIGITKVLSLSPDLDALAARDVYIEPMSRAFVKESDGSEALELPERLVSPHPNLVTPEGLAQIEAEVDRLSRLYAVAQAGGERAALASLARDLRYWNARLASAEVVTPPADTSEVHFGSRVTIEREDGRKLTYRIVGEDEADPAHGTVSYVSPLAKALMGKSVGDTARVGAGDAEIIAIA
jgi:transcription elongation GreA/GreB family factor